MELILKLRRKRLRLLPDYSTSQTYSLLITSKKNTNYSLLITSKKNTKRLIMCQRKLKLSNSNHCFLMRYGDNHNKRFSRISCHICAKMGDIKRKCNFPRRSVSLAYISPIIRRSVKMFFPDLTNNRKI